MKKVSLKIISALLVLAMALGSFSTLSATAQTKETKATKAQGTIYMGLNETKPIQIGNSNVQYAVYKQVDNIPLDVSYANGNLTLVSKGVAGTTKVFCYGNSTAAVEYDVIIGSGSTGGLTSTVNIAANQQQTVNLPSGYTVAGSAYFTQGSTNIAYVSNIITGASYFTITGVNNGTVTLNIPVLIAGSSSTTYTCNIIVGSGSNTNTSRNVSVEVNKTEQGTLSGGEVLNSSPILVSGNSNIVNVYGSINSQTINFTGLSVGQATYTVQTRNTYTNALTNYTFYVSVIGSSQSTTKTVTVTANNNQYVTLDANDVVASTPTIISGYDIASISGTVGYSQVMVTGIRAGNAIATVNVRNSTTGITRIVTINIAVSGGSGGGSTQQTVYITTGGKSSVGTFDDAVSISSTNPSVATASFEYSTKRIIIEGRTAGTATISASVRYSAGSGYSQVQIPVSVSGSTGGSSSSSTDGVYLGSTKRYNVSRNKKYSLKTIKYDGRTVSASSLLWVSSNPKIATVDTNGKIITKASGTCNIIALDDTGERSAYVTFIVK